MKKESLGRTSYVSLSCVNSWWTKTKKISILIWRLFEEHERRDPIDSGLLCFFPCSFFPSCSRKKNTLTLVGFISPFPSKKSWSLAKVPVHHGTEELLIAHLCHRSKGRAGGARTVCVYTIRMDVRIGWSSQPNLVRLASEVFFSES